VIVQRGFVACLDEKKRLTPEEVKRIIYAINRPLLSTPGIASM
jgi:hypothetical protein